MIRIASFLICLLLAACDVTPSTSAAPEPVPAVLILKDAPVLDVALQDVVDTYVLGGNRTDLQREAMTAKLVGATVSWQLKVYDISKEDGRYRVMSALLDGSDPNSLGKFSVVAFVSPRDEQDDQTMLQLQTGSEIQIRGRVDGVSARMVLVLSPAELVP